jgi:hypothetical protein
MMRLRREVHSYLPLADYQRLQQEASARGVSLSKCVSDCLREYLALRAEMAGVAAAPGKLGEPHQGVIHALLARTEERLAATLEAHAEGTASLQERLRVLESMLDRLTLLYLIHTPELPEERKDGAVAAAKPRLLKWRRAVERQLQAGDGNGDGANAADAGERGQRVDRGSRGLVSDVGTATPGAPERGRS